MPSSASWCARFSLCCWASWRVHQSAITSSRLSALSPPYAGALVAVWGSRWVVHGATREEPNCFLDAARGLVTAVLALEIVKERGQVFSFLPAMAFTVVLVTNLFIVWGSVRAGRVASAVASAGQAAIPAAVMDQTGTISAPPELPDVSSLGELPGEGAAASSSAELPAKAAGASWRSMKKVRVIPHR